MLRLFIIIFMFTSATCNAETISERLNNIENKISNIEKKLDAIISKENDQEIGENLINRIIDLVEKNKLQEKNNVRKEKKGNQSNLVFKVNYIDYERGDGTLENMWSKFIFSYSLINNYKKKVNSIKGQVTFRDAFGDKIAGPVALIKDVYVGAGNSKNFQGSISDITEKYSRLGSVKEKDVKTIFLVDKIAFDDGTVINVR